MTQIKTETASQAARREMEELKTKLPKDWRMRFFTSHPEYDNYRGGQLLNNVFTGRSTDVYILAELKKIAEEYQFELLAKSHE